MVIRVLIPLLVSLLFFISCTSKSDSRQTTSSVDSIDNVITSTYEDGTLRVEIPYKNGKKNGQSKEFYKSGKLFQAIDYVNSKKHGFARKYYEDGLLNQETPYDSNRIHGIQKKYRKDGKIAFEMPYFFGQACAGVKEYGINGDLKMEYPSLIIRPVDQILTYDQYKLVLTMSEDVREVTYYQGKLTDGTCLGKNVEEICCTDKSDKAEMIFPVSSGQFIMKEVYIIAKVKTTQGNYYLTQGKFNVAAENRY